MHIMHNIILS